MSEQEYSPEEYFEPPFAVILDKNGEIREKNVKLESCARFRYLVDGDDEPGRPHSGYIELVAPEIFAIDWIQHLTRIQGNIRNIHIFLCDIKSFEYKLAEEIRNEENFSSPKMIRRLLQEKHPGIDMELFEGTVNMTGTMLSSH